MLATTGAESIQDGGKTKITRKVNIATCGVCVQSIFTPVWAHNYHFQCSWFIACPCAKIALLHVRNAPSHEAMIAPQIESFRNTRLCLHKHSSYLCVIFFSGRSIASCVYIIMQLFNCDCVYCPQIAMPATREKATAAPTTTTSNNCDNTQRQLTAARLYGISNDSNTATIAHTHFYSFFPVFLQIFTLFSRISTNFHTFSPFSTNNVGFSSRSPFAACARRLPTTRSADGQRNRAFNRQKGKQQRQTAANRHEGGVRDELAGGVPAEAIMRNCRQADQHHHRQGAKSHGTD